MHAESTNAFVAGAQADQHRTVAILDDSDAIRPVCARRRRERVDRREAGGLDVVGALRYEHCFVRRCGGGATGAAGGPGNV